MTQTLRGDRYVIDGTLGEGSQATTFSAYDRLEGRYVAIKRFEVRGAKSWKDVELAEREANVLGSLSHPKLPKYMEHFEEDGALYLVMEKIEGVTLKSLMKSGSKLGERDIERLLHDLGEICAYLHGRAPPIVHRDIKPGNVIRRPDGSFALVDFGAVRDRLRPEGGSTVVGTFGYMAPEQFQGRASPASDWYAIGATCLAAWTGEEPEKLPHRGLKIDVRASLPQTRNSALASTINALLEPDPDARRLPRADSADPGKRESKRTKPERSPRREGKRDEKRADKRRRRSARRENATQNGPPSLLPGWVRAMFWIAWAIAWPVIAETRVLVVPWIILPFMASMFGRWVLRSSSERQVPPGASVVSANAEPRVRVAAEEPRVIDAELVEEEDTAPRREDASHRTRRAR